MLLQLEITNFAIIEKSILRFDDGFNVLSGETGAGKSIILGAISAILGERINKSMIRKGEEQAVCRAVFFKTDRLKHKLMEKKMLIEDDTIIVERIISRNGRSLVKVNDTVQTTQMVRELCSELVELCGQKDHLNLLKEGQALHMIDQMGDGEHKKRLAAYKEQLKEYHSLQKEIEELNTNEREKQQLLDLYRFQQDEIESLNLVEGEDEELEKERKQLRHMETIVGNTQEAVTKLEAVQEVYQGFLALSEAAKYDEKLIPLAKRIESAYYELDDVKSELQSQVDVDDYGEERLDQVESRLHSINGLKRKYADTIPGILEHLELVSKKRNEFENTEETLLALKEKEAKTEKKLRELSSKLHQSRVELAQEQGEKISQAIKSLSMPDAMLEFQCEKTERFNKNGRTNIQIYFTSNKGEDLKPLAKVASGGELSRVLLAMHMVQHTEDGVSTLLFDEVDEGIGGEVGSVIGKRLKELSKSVQVIAISHLPQVAAKAEHHHIIEKETEGDRTVSKVRKLTEGERVDEIARMIYGDERTEITLKQAKDMLSN